MNYIESYYAFIIASTIIIGSALRAPIWVIFMSLLLMLVFAGFVWTKGVKDLVFILTIYGFIAVLFIKTVVNGLLSKLTDGSLLFHNQKMGMY